MMQPDCFESVQPECKDPEEPCLRPPLFPGQHRKNLTDRDSALCLGSCCLACKAPDCKTPDPHLDEENGNIQTVSTQPKGEGATDYDLVQVHSRSQELMRGISLRRTLHWAGSLWRYRPSELSFVQRRVYTMLQDQPNTLTCSCLIPG